MTVASIFGAAVYGCGQAGKSEIPVGVRPAVPEEIIDVAPDHLVVVAFEADPELIKAAATEFAGKAEFVTVNDNPELMMQMGVENTPAVKFILPGGASDECLIGDFDSDELFTMIRERL